MTGGRLSLALGDPDALPPEGTILLLHPPAGTDLRDLPKDRLRIVQGFRPDHDAWQAQGFSVAPEAAGDHVAAIVFLPRARDFGRALVAEAAARLPDGAPIWVDGQKTDGIDTMLRDLRLRTAVDAPYAKAHGKIFRFANPGAAPFGDWVARTTTVTAGFVTRPGVFAASGPDRGSVLLAAALPDGLHGKVADLGAGWGWLSAQILAHPGVRELHLIEADHTALDCARMNITDPRAHFHWADATRFAPAQRLDVVIMNPPFHISRAADPALGLAFIRAAAGMLAPSGRLYMVANRHLPYEAALAGLFRSVTEVAGDGGFKIIFGANPITQRPGR